MFQQRLKWRSVIATLSLLTVCCLVYSQSSSRYPSLSDRKTQFYSSLSAWSVVKIYGWSQSSTMLRSPLDRNMLSPYDQFLIDRSPDLNASLVSDLLVLGAIAAPVGLMLRHKDQWSQILYLSLQGFLLENSINQLTKHVVGRPRPGVYRQQGATFGKSLHPNSTRSFYSGHTSTAAFITMLSARIFSDLHPSDSAKILCWSGATALTAAVGIMRVRSGKHFVSDVLVGSLVGGAIGILTPALLRNPKASIRGGASGLSISWTLGD